ncbi:NAD(P)/FAD-dependent oxidoreductase [Saccharopolyspora erythraea]|uniref:NAD(P)/FAD-dependent oxidoreductase n=1 Tax=Saccharopolyspora erythraea TaxID=1836 RepID=UPI001BA62551|nr:NAD(P)/FAD-dependent oxidoreductase [Saccharopolyspora erythraea]QUH01512.1 NAD(P)/FAD-dependent oxidoreductase [Saccharopolyspora erythraea]
MTDTYDVVVNGASVAGCAAAVLYARRGAKVALLERRSDINAHKVLCTHYIQPCGYPVLAELGLIGELEEAGAVRNSAQYWTRWGWIRPEDRVGPGVLPHGYNVRREVLDPMLRRLAASTKGVDLLLGHTVNELLTDDGRVVGVAGTAGGERFEVRATLVVGADGKDSAIAKLAGTPSETSPNNRFSYFAHFRGLPRPEGHSAKAYYLEPDNAYVMPNDDDITVISVLPSMERLGEFKADLEGAYRRFVKALPDAPDIDAAERVTKITGTVNYPLVVRESTGPGYALVGDAALTSDPLAAVGCAWAMQSAHWLADTTAPAVLGHGDLGAALNNYRKRRAENLKAHAHLIADYATARPFNHIERFTFSAAARDSRMAEHFHVFGSRLMSVPDFLSPWAVARCSMVNGRALLRPRAQPVHSGERVLTGQGAR